MDERRREKRISIATEGRIADEFSNLWSPYAWAPMSVADVSKSGIGFHTVERMRVGSRRDFRIPLPDGNGILKFSGDVVYLREMATAGTFHVGIAIAKIKPVYADRIGAFLDALSEAVH